MYLAIRKGADSTICSLFMLKKLGSNDIIGVSKQRQVYTLNITVIVELENNEVENILGASFLFEKEQIHDNIIHTCVEGFVDNETNEKLDIDEAMEKVFDTLKEKHGLSAAVEDFSYELPSCERIKHVDGNDEIPQKVMISYTEHR